MKVSAFIALAKSSVLKQLALDDPEILSFVNLAVLQIYKRFPINVKEQVVVLQDDLHIYDLNPDVMSLVSAFTGENYLKDSTGSLISTGSSSTSIAEVTLNDSTDPNTVMTPTPGTIMVNYPSSGQLLSLLYRAGSVDIEADELDEQLKITPQYIEPLLMYMGYLGYTSINSTTGVGDTFLTKYNIACAALAKEGITNKNTNTNNKLKGRGFV